MRQCFHCLLKENLEETDTTREARKRAAADVFLPDESLSMLASELLQAIEHDQLLLYYQPQVSITTSRVVGVEALVRWQHPQHGLLLPEQFIPCAERTGLIEPLSLWVLNAALRQCHAWQQDKLDLRVAVNLSMQNLENPRLVDSIAGLLQTWGVAPAGLAVEITESTLATNLQRVKETLTCLNKIGVCTALDDFGIGYSSLASLKRLPVNEIKIDKSFVISMVGDDHDAAIVRFAINLGHQLGLAVVAEGVEDRATWELLAACDCDMAQGYYLSHPLPAADLAYCLRKWACRL